MRSDGYICGFIFLLEVIKGDFISDSGIIFDFSIEIPTLFGKNGKYYCPKCKTDHHHGDGSVEGHRVAHCGDIKNYPRGYYVKEV